MNTSLQLSLARDHQQELRRHVAAAQLEPVMRGNRPGAFASSVRAAAARTRGLWSSVVHVTAVTSPTQLAGDSATAAHRLRW